MTRKFYALHAPYGTSAVYNNLNWPTVHVFGSSEARNKWVDERDQHRRAKCSYKQAMKYLGTDNELEKHL